MTFADTIQRFDYDRLHNLVFSGGYTGYRPTVTESPNGDGKLDTEKRFAHVATKYRHENARAQMVLDGYLLRAHRLAVEVARALDVPDAFMPRLDYGALRVLEYPPGAISHEHQDFDLFTIMLYRDQPDRFVSDWHGMPAAVRALNAQCHMGQIGEELGLGWTATRHSVRPSETTQRSVVYFAIPDWAAVLPSGLTVGAWLEERLYRSRVYT